MAASAPAPAPAPAPASNTKSAGPRQLIPPEEKFWKRYSPHGEAPLSFAGSVATHALVFGLIFLFGLYLASLFGKQTGSIPIEPVRFAGGGGKKDGVGSGPGVGKGVEDLGKGEKSTDRAHDGIDEAPALPPLSPVEKKRIEEKFGADARVISQSSSESTRAYTRLEDSIRRKLADGLQPGKGEGGPGSGGGKGTGTGTGEGPGDGPGKATLTKREKRMLRWHMRFTANTGLEYLGQLRGLGAILAFPVTEGPEPQYKVVKDLRPGGALLDEDLSSIQRIYWIDDKPRSVTDILAALKITLPRLPSRFVAFMPEKLEKQLFDMERRYVERILRKKFDEDRIHETQFRVVLTPRGYQPELISVSMR